ncbi:ankyrin repeat-containing domain protein [Lanmaoa asiatica]|nr:ankyrin repeat-containing domain protein [Lanmaoa asiatica]
MNSAQKTLIDIASVSQRVVDTLDVYVGRKTIESFRLHKIVVCYRTVLEALNKTLLLEDGNADDRLVDWLNSEEPQARLHTLNQMEVILKRKVEYGVKSFFNASWSPHTQDKNGEAIRLFQMCKSYFHFLLTTDIWNHENGTPQQPPSLIAQPDVSHIDQACDRRGIATATQFKNGDPSRATQAKKRSMKGKQGMNLGKLDGILGWLKAWNSRKTHEHTILLRQPDPCTWLLKTSAYKKWKSTESSFLWLHGKREVIEAYHYFVSKSASVIEGLKDTLQYGEVLAYFYCDFRDERSTSAAEVMRSLLSQLLQQLRRHAVDPGGLIDELVEERDGGGSTISNVTLLARHFSRAAEQFQEPPFIVIDALDECKNVEELVNALAKLLEGGIRLLAISRPLQIIKDGFSGLPFIDMEAMSYRILADIRLHVTRELDSHQRLRIVDANLKEEIYSALCKKAGGMFRWVQCQLNTLKQCVTASELRDALSDLPSDLHATYGRILLEIDRATREGKIVRRALYWLVAALEPLQLSQIMEGLSIDLGRRAMDHDSRPVHGAALLDSLGSLVTYNEVTDIVILSHFSVKTLRQPEYDGIPFQKTPSLQLFESHPLLQYVLSVGFSHLTHVNPRNRAILRAIEDFHLSARQHPSEWKQLYERADPPLISQLNVEHDLALYILIGFAPERLLRSFIGRMQLQPKDGTNPLIYAANFGKIEHARTLLSRGTNPNHQGLNVWDSRQALPLDCHKGSHVPHGLFMEVLKEGLNLISARIVSRLLQTDDFVEWVADIRDESIIPRALDDRRYPLLSGKPSEQDIDILKRRLIRTGYNPPARFDEAFLRYAVSAGHVSTVKHMLSLDIPFPPDIILDASRSMNSTMIRLFLDMGCEVDVASPMEGTPIHLVATLGLSLEDDYFNCVCLLVDAGCNPSAHNLAGETTLHLAARHGYVSVVEYLLSLQVPLLPDILLEVSETAIIRSLIRQGADARAIAANGNTPLHLVLRHPRINSDDNLERAEILVDAGCNPFLPNGLGETALDVAAKYGLLPVVRYLLSISAPLPPDVLLSAVGYPYSTTTSVIKVLIDNGADIHATRLRGNTPLHLTMTAQPEAECLRRIKILVNAGCDPRACNLAGKTPFHFAARQRYVLAMEYLLSLGVSVPSDVMLTQFERFVSHAPQRKRRLHFAAGFQLEHYALEFAKLFVHAGCKPAILNSKRKTPLHVAAKNGYISVVGYFLSLGVSLPPDILLAASTGSSENIEVIRYLIKKCADASVVATDGDTPLHLLVTEGSQDDHLESVRILIDAGCDPRAQNSNNETPMHAAARCRSISVLEYLLAQGVPLPEDILLTSAPSTIRFLAGKGTDVRCVASNVDMQLMHQALDYHDEEDCLECAKILVGAGWNPLLRNSAGETPIHVAVRHGQLSTIKYLLSRCDNASLPSDALLTVVPSDICGNATTSSKDTPLHLLLRSKPMLDEHDEYVQTNLWKVVEILLGCGADPSARNADGQTPIDIAEANGHFFNENFLRLVRNSRDRMRS